MKICPVLLSAEWKAMEAKGHENQMAEAYLESRVSLPSLTSHVCVGGE